MDLKLVPLEKLDDLLFNVLGSFQASLLYVILMTPACTIVRVFPSLKYSQIGQMVSLMMIELGLFLISNSLFLFWSIENILNG